MAYKDLEKKKETDRKATRKYKKTHQNQVIKDRQKFKETLKLHPEICKKYNLKQRYGITIREIQNLFTTQSGRCAICYCLLDNISLDKEHRSKNIRIDHDHSTGKVRGLLCKSCNALLGMCNDDINILHGAIAYLKQTIYKDIIKCLN